MLKIESRAFPKIVLFLIYNNGKTRIHLCFINNCRWRRRTNGSRPAAGKPRDSHGGNALKLNSTHVIMPRYVLFWVLLMLMADWAGMKSRD